MSGERRIYSSVTYTLTADCQQEWRLSCDIPSTSEDAAATITIEGGGFTINAFQDTSGYLDVFRLTGKCALVLKNVTINGGGYQGTGAIQLTNSDVASSFSNVTFTNTVYNALRFDDQREDSPGTTHTLSNVLIENTTGSYRSSLFGHASGIQALGNVNLNINNLALRNVRGGNAAIGANETQIPGRNVSLGTITLTGCLTVDGVFPRVYYGNIVDNTTDVCSGTVGNNGSAAIQYPQAAASPCGLPLSGFIYGRQTYNLRGDCALSGALYIPYKSSVVINGNKFTIDAAAAGAQPIAVAGGFSLKNAVVSGATGSPVVTYLAKTMSISNAEFRDNGGPLLIQDSVISLNAVLIENHSVSAATSPSALHVSKHAQVSIRDTVFRNNMGGVGALHAGSPSVHVLVGPHPSTTLEGCISFESNSPADIVDDDSLLTDSRDGPCPPDMAFLVDPLPPSSDRPPREPESPPQHKSSSAVCDGIRDAIALGAVACIFREGDRLDVYGINEQSQGFFMTSATQAQIDARACPGLVARSHDGRAAIFAEAFGNITVAVGPDFQGKIAHVTIGGGVHGAVISIFTTYGPPPGTTGSADAQTCASRLSNCMVRTKYIVNFRDAPNGSLLRFWDIWGAANDGMLPYNVTLTALERTSDWFKVDYHGTQGWISAHYVEPIGTCG